MGGWPRPDLFQCLLQFARGKGVDDVCIHTGFERLCPEQFAAVHNDEGYLCQSWVFLACFEEFKGVRLGHGYAADDKIGGVSLEKGEGFAPVRRPPVVFKAHLLHLYAQERSYHWIGLNDQDLQLALSSLLLNPYLVYASRRGPLPGRPPKHSTRNGNSFRRHAAQFPGKPLTDVFFDRFFGFEEGFTTRCINLREENTDLRTTAPPPLHVNLSRHGESDAGNLTYDTVFEACDIKEHQQAYLS